MGITSGDTSTLRMPGEGCAIVALDTSTWIQIVMQQPESGPLTAAMCSTIVATEEELGEGRSLVRVE